MQLVDRDTVRELAESPDPDAALVFTHGGCVVVHLGEDAVPEAGVLIVRRHEIEREVAGGAVPEDRLDALVHCLDNMARDIGA